MLFDSCIECSSFIIPVSAVQVPEQYKLLGYNKLLVPFEGSFTLSDVKDRPLLRGAEVGDVHVHAELRIMARLVLLKSFA